MNENYIATNIKFDPEPESIDLKLLKIKNGFMCDEDEAKRILEVINSKGNLEITHNQNYNAYKFGIKFNSKSFSQIEREAQLKSEREEKEKQLELKRIEARKWFNTLNEKDKEFVKVLAFDFCFTVS